MILRHSDFKSLLPLPMRKNLFLYILFFTVYYYYAFYMFYMYTTYIFWPTFSIYMVQTFFKIIWRQFLATHSERLILSSASLLCKTWNVSALSMLVYYNTNSCFLRSFLVCTGTIQFINKGFKCFWANFFILKFHWFMLLLNFITPKYSFFGRII